MATEPTPIKNADTLLIEELERRLSQYPKEKTGGIMDLYKSSIQSIIDNIRKGVYKAEDPSYKLRIDLQRCGFFDLARQVLSY